MNMLCHKARIYWHGRMSCYITYNYYICMGFILDLISCFLRTNNWSSRKFPLLYGNLLSVLGTSLLARNSKKVPLPIIWNYSLHEILYLYKAVQKHSRCYLYEAVNHLGLIKNEEKSIDIYSTIYRINHIIS